MFPPMLAQLEMTIWLFNRVPVWPESLLGSLGNVVQSLYDSDVVSNCSCVDLAVNKSSCLQMH